MANRRNTRNALISMLIAVSAMGPGSVAAVQLLQPGDSILAIDTDPPTPSSDYPGAEGPDNVLDADSLTKYLNFGAVNSGFIVTPVAGSTVLQSFVLTTANDAPARDPSAWALWGTNDTINSTDNSFGDGEAWTVIASGSVSLPDARQTDGPVVPVANSTAYTSYRLVFTDLKDAATANSMQVADVQFFESPDGSGTGFLGPGDAILAVDVDSDPDSGYPMIENPQNAIDGMAASKYLNFGAENSGFIVTPSVAPTVVISFTMTTANDFEDRDPASYELYGTNDPIASTDNSQGTAESWTLIASGPLALPAARLTSAGPVLVSNSTAYSSYRMIFPTLKDANTANSMQFAEIQFEGTIATDLTIEKTATLQSDGSTVVFTLVVDNLGAGDATGVVVIDALPACTMYVSDDCGGAVIPPWTWTIGDLASAASTSCNLTVDAFGCVGLGPQTNSASVQGDQVDLDSGNDSDDAEFEVRVVNIPTLSAIALLVLIAGLASVGSLVLSRRG